MGYSEDEVDEYSAIWRHPASSVPGGKVAACHRIVEHGWAYRQPESLPLVHIWGFKEENPGRAGSGDEPANK
jgi:hypothetical protein